MRFMDKLSASPSALEKSRNAAEKDIGRIEKELAGVSVRLDAANEKFNAAKTTIEQLRRDRAELLADGGDSKVLDKQIGDFRQEIEKTSDELVGLQGRIAGKESELKSLQEGLKTIEADIGLAGLFALLDDYNKIAPDLAAVVTKIHVKAKELRIPIEKLPGLAREFHYKRDHYGAIDIIPRFVPEGLRRTAEEMEKLGPGADPMRPIDEIAFFDKDTYDSPAFFGNK